MSAAANDCQHSTASILIELRHHEAEYPELVHGPLCGHAAARIEALEKALREIRKHVVARNRPGLMASMRLDVIEKLIDAALQSSSEASHG